jgi:hypothetical protein
MPHKPKPSGPIDNSLDSTGISLTELPATIERLASEVRVLRESVDELREVVEWTGENSRQDEWRPIQVPLVKMPLDPLDPEWSQKLKWGREPVIIPPTPKPAAPVEQPAQLPLVGQQRKLL